MNYEKLKENHNSVFREKIAETIVDSKNDWLLITFTANGEFIDDFGIKRQVVNEDNLSRYARGIDWTINHLKRKFHLKRMKFIPFVGGDNDNKSKNRINFHVHAYLELPKINMKKQTKELLSLEWARYIKRSYKFNLTTNCWIDDVHKDYVRKNIWYNQRFEGNQFQYGTEKLFISCNSCYF
jgi:hypothetical protein